MCIYYAAHTIQVHFIFFIQCFLVFPFDLLFGHDFIHVYNIISYMLAEALQSEGSHKMKFDGVYEIMVFTLYRSANWKCPKCGKIALCYLVLCCSLLPFVF